jgi:hypothetical protein
MIVGVVVHMRVQGAILGHFPARLEKRIQRAHHVAL